MTAATQGVDKRANDEQVAAVADPARRAGPGPALGENAAGEP